MSVIIDEQESVLRKTERMLVDDEMQPCTQIGYIHMKMMVY